MARDAASQRARIEKTLGRGLTESEWDLVIRRATTPANEKEPDLLLRDLLAEARELPRSHRPSASVFEPDVPDDPRWEALRRIFALQAGRDPAVVSWRSRHLPGGLLRSEERELADFVVARFVEDEPRLGDFRPIPLRWRGPTPEDDDVGGSFMRGEHGCLAELADVADMLLAATPWQHEEAVHFVLTGLAPRVHRIKADILIGESLASTRIKLDIDPRTPKDAVAQMYEHARRSHLPLMDTKLPKRAWPVDEKKAAIAEFLSGREDATWEQHRDAWNAAHPEWSYSEVRDFGRDAARARDSVLGPLEAERQPDIG